MDLIQQFYGFCNTPPIFEKSDFGDFNIFEFPKLESTHHLIDELQELQHPRNFVLGKRMESFFEIVINNSARYDIIGSNIQIIHEKQTLGELDFLLFDNERQKPLHVELVYKLYIYDPKLSSEIEKWIGPNRRDSFAAKLKRLKEHQFPLLYRKETLEYLEKFSLDVKEIEQQLCFKAKLFTPELKSFHPNLINSNCISGNWFRLSDFLNKPWKDNVFFSPSKKEWSSDPKKNDSWLSYNELLEQAEILFKKEKSPLIWMKSKNLVHSFFLVWW